MSLPCWSLKLTFSLLLLLFATSALTAGLVAREPADEQSGANLLLNPGFDSVEGWGPWASGFELTSEGREGSACARLSPPSNDVETGISQSITFDQPVQAPILASAWSKAEDVTGPANPGYSVYLDIEYADGDNLWGQTAAFAPGTHDWQQAQVMVFPTKPVKRVTMHLLLRWKTGTAWFDDASLSVLQGATNSYLLDGGFYKPPAREAIGSVKDPVHLENTSGLGLTLDGATGEVCEVLINGEELPLARRGGFFARDVASGGAAHWFRGIVHRTSGDQVTFEGACEPLGLTLTATLDATGPAIYAQGEVRDTRGKPRAITVYFGLPVNAEGWRFCEQADQSRPIESTADYARFARCGAGALGQHSIYPLAPIAGPVGLAVGVPMETPQLWRGRYDGAAKELQVALDFGLLPSHRKYPSRAPFAFSLFTFRPEWDFRGALEAYYRVYPASFAKRTDQSGLWMAFTDISTVQQPEDFGFMFHEGNNNVAWDDAHNILSFVYTEPTSYWINLPKDYSRELGPVVEEVERRAAGGDRGAQFALTSGIWDASGQLVFVPAEVPWASGGMFIVSPDPGITAPAGWITKAQLEQEQLYGAFEAGSSASFGAWTVNGQATLDNATSRSGASLKVSRGEGDREVYIIQRFSLPEPSAKPLVLGAWCKAEGVTGEPGADFSLYVDAKYEDGTDLFGQVAPFATGTYDWQYSEHTIRPEKPLKSLAVHLLLRGDKTGAAWFDEVAVRYEDSQENLLKDGDFGGQEQQAELDGIYIDSSEMASDDVDLRPDHLENASFPLCFDASTHQPALPLIFATQAFLADLSSWLIKRDKLMMANTTPLRWYHFMPYLDAAGIETNWNPGGHWTPDSRDWFNLRRALSGQKPYLLLQNTHYDDFSHELVERYFKRCAHFATFPGFFSENAATECYFENPALYNRDRPLFVRYLPVIKSLQQAGWQPVPYAKASGEQLGVERYGCLESGECYLTVFNFGSEAAQVELRLEAGYFGPATRLVPVLPEALPGFKAQGLKAEFTLGAEEIVVLRAGATGG